LDEQLAVVVEEQVPVFSFTFGIPDFAEVKSAGATIVGTATTVGEARALEAAGVDVVVAQGWEAGGHRGTFERSPAEVEVGSLALVPQVVDAVSVPVLAAGGIMDGRGIAAALALGAGGASLGTAFLTASETATPPAFRRLLARTPAEGTRVSRVFSGREARLVRTDAVEELVGSGQPPAPFPLQLDLTRPIHLAGLQADDPSRLFALAGQGAALVREAAAADLVETLVAETERAISRLSGDPSG
jgi:nitronate monooxygenase